MSRTASEAELLTGTYRVGIDLGDVVDTMALLAREIRACGSGCCVVQWAVVKGRFAVWNWCVENHVCVGGGEYTQKGECQEWYEHGYQMWASSV